MDAAHADEIALDGLETADQVEGQERDVDALPLYWVQEVQQAFTQVDHCMIVHAEHLHHLQLTRMCLSSNRFFQREIRLLMPTRSMLPKMSTFGVSKHCLTTLTSLISTPEFGQSNTVIDSLSRLTLGRNKKDK